MLQIEELIENLNLLFSIGDYENAEKLVEGARNIPSLYNDTVAIFDANLCLAKGNYSEMWIAITRGLTCNPFNYELYVMLGEYYLNSNPNQAFLCFENALFYCDNDTDFMQIQELITTLKSENSITVNNVSFIILSCNTSDFTQKCIESIQENCLETCREIIITDDNSTTNNIEKACKENDVFFLHNDTYLPPNALFWLRMGLYENDNVGATGSLTNSADNLQARPFENPCDEAFLEFALRCNTPQEYPYEEKLYLEGFALLIKRAVYDKIGSFDEQFAPRTYEYNDYGLRILQAGYKNVLCKNSFIIHYNINSSKEAYANNIDLFETNAVKFKEKWKISPKYYFYSRPELVKLVAEKKAAPINVLEIGCGCAATSAFIKGMYPNASLYGVEIVPEVANIAKHISDVICADIETLDFPWEEDFFDYVIMGDVLEHLREPSIVLKKLRKHIKQGGHIIVSMPNMKHYSVMIPLLENDEFTYKDAGILDTTHLKMYTCTEIRRLITNSGYEIEDISSITIEDSSPKVQQFIDLLVKLSSTKDKTQYLTYQYIVKARK